MENNLSSLDDRQAIEFGHSSQDFEYGVSASSFLSAYIPPQLSTPASSLSSEMMSESSSSSNFDGFSRSSPTPVQWFQPTGKVAAHYQRRIGHSVLAEFPDRPITPPGQDQASFAEGVSNDPYMECHPFLAGFEPNSFTPNVCEGSDFTTKQLGWDCMVFGRNSASGHPTLANEKISLCPAIYDQKFAAQDNKCTPKGEFSPVYPVSEDVMKCPSSTVLPSQTLKYPISSPSLSTPFVSPVKQQALSGSSVEDESKFNLENLAKQHGSLGTYEPLDAYAFSSHGIVDDSITAEPNIFAGFVPQPATWRKRRRLDNESETDELGQKVQLGGPKIPYEVTRATPYLEKPHPCHSCHKGFDRQEHLTRHNKTDIHLKTLRDLGIPSLDPPPPTTPCPFCGKAFNRSDNLKPHILTHMQREERNYRNDPVSIAESRSKGQAKIDPRINLTSRLKKRSGKKARTKQTV